MSNSEIAEIGLFIKNLEKEFEGQQQKKTEKKQRKRRRVGYFRNTDSESAHRSDIYRKAIIAEFLRGK